MDPLHLAWALDPALLMHDAAGFDSDPWQREALYAPEDRLLLLCSRQAGKSTTTAVVALHTALFTAGALVLLLSPSERQSGELFRKCMMFYRALGEPIPATKETALTIALANDSRIVSLPGSESTVRCYSGVNLLVLDEAASVPDDLLIATSPMRAVSGGRLVALSSPKGRRGWFYQAWTDGLAPWRRIKATAHDCPRISPEFLECERRTLGERFYRQEYLCSFEDTVDQYFSGEAIEAAFRDDVRPLFGGSRHA
jgi:hypothetical protein